MGSEAPNQPYLVNSVLTVGDENIPIQKLIDEDLQKRIDERELNFTCTLALPGSIRISVLHETCIRRGPGKGRMRKMWVTFKYYPTREE